MFHSLTDQIAEALRSAGKGTILTGLIGKGIQLSRTPSMHMDEARAQGLDMLYLRFDPELWDGPEPSIAEMLDRIEVAGFSGLNITYPYKKAVMAHLDELSEAAQNVGAVNTVVFGNGRRMGHNTDFWGFAESLRRALPDGPFGTVLLLGAGGAGGAVGHALKSLGVRQLLISDTDPASAQALATATGGTPCSDLAQAALAADGIVNATPMGMAKLPGTAIDTKLLQPRHWVADIVYFPLETALLAAARARGCTCISGAGMAVFQAVRAFDLFTGHAPDIARMQASFAAFGDSGTQGKDCS